MTVNIDGMNINYQISGEGSDILFLHGWGSSLDAFNRMIAFLSQDFRCIAVDLPGFGKSDMPQKPLTLQDYCDFVKKFMDELKLENPIMVGHSNGGRITLNMCATGMVEPEKIVLFGSAGIRSKRTLKQKFRLFSFKTIKHVLTLPIIKNYTADLLDAARKHYGSADYNAAPVVLRQTLVNLVNTDLRDILPNIKASTLLIYGENDTETPISHAKVIESKIKDCGLCVIKGGSHFCFVEFPGQVDAILQSFLGGKND
ncbi:MAG: alpha/beta hydrolase [Clostridia bacterium]|nr:alpha/beta hydrolase [Clostridia bacterium]